MGKKSQSLGRGLGAILGEVAEAYENEFKSGEAEGERIVEIPLDDISPNPYQPRTHFDEEAIAELAESIRRHGLLQPVVVIERDEDEYILIAGERRVRASRRAGLSTIRAIVADIDESRFRELALIENIQREALNPIELARSYKELIEEYGITQEELAGIVHKSRSQIANTLRLLQLDDYVTQKVANGQLSQGHAKVLVGLDPEQQRVACDTITGQKLNVREAEALVAGLKRPRQESGGPKRERPTLLDLTPYRQIIEENVPFRITIKRSKLEISFRDESELKAFMRAISKEAAKK